MHALETPVQLHTGAPARSRQQRLDALQTANRIRSTRAVLKVELKAGRADFLALLIDPPEWLMTAKIFDILLALPKVGRVKANKALQRGSISPSKTIGGLSDRQRGELVAIVGGLGGGGRTR
jgi:hypothetical protein